MSTVSFISLGGRDQLGQTLNKHTVHNNETLKVFEQTLISHVSMPSAIFKRTLTAGYMNLYRNKLALLIANVFAHRKPQKELKTFVYNSVNVMTRDLKYSMACNR